MNAGARVLLLCLCALGYSGWCEAADRSVKSSGELVEVMKTSKAGDRILLAPGRYALSAQVTAGPLTITAAEAKDKPVLSPAEGAAFVIDIGNVEGTITVRGLVFDGGDKEASALQTLGSRLEVEDCLFRNFSGKAVVRSGTGKDRAALRGVRITRCEFRDNRKARGVDSLGPLLVEDSEFVNTRQAVNANDWTGKWGHKPRRDYKVILRHNRVWRTEGTDMKCQGFTTRTTAPEIYDNVLSDFSKGDCSAMTIAANGVEDQGIPTAAEVYRNLIIDRWKSADSGMVHEAIEYGEYNPTKGRIYENVFVARVQMWPALYNKGSNNEWFNNTCYGNNRIFHCTGRDCRFYNNISVGGRAEGNYFARKDWEANKAKVVTQTLEYSCFWKVDHVKDREFHKGKGYFEADPKFVDPEQLDFHLRCDSPCINKGEGSRDGLTPADLGAFEYPIQVCDFKVDDEGNATWRWSNDFQKVSKRVRIRWNAKQFPESADAEGDETVAEVDASKTSAPTGKRSGYFAAFVLDARNRWSGPTPDGVHRFAVGVK